MLLSLGVLSSNKEKRNATKQKKIPKKTIEEKIKSKLNAVSLLFVSSLFGYLFATRSKHLSWNIPIKRNPSIAINGIGSKMESYSFKKYNFAKTEIIIAAIPKEIQNKIMQTIFSFNNLF
jgi:hypothetical protein